MVSLQSREVQKKLLDLYTSPYMSSSVKLHIVNSLDQTTRLKEGLDWLLGRHHVQVIVTVLFPPTEHSNWQRMGYFFHSVHMYLCDCA